MEVEILRNLPNPEFHELRTWVDIQLDSTIDSSEWLEPNMYDTSEFFNPLSLANAPSPPTSYPLCAPESGNNISPFKSTSEFFNPLSLVNAPSSPTSYPLCAPESGNNLSLFKSTPKQGHYITSHRRIATSTPNDCVECRESFPSKADLLHHARVVQHQPYGCECSALFSRLDVLHRHLESFTEDPKYPCKFCKRYRGSDGFARLDHLQQHIRGYHHLEPTEVEKETESIRSRTERALPVCSHLGCPQYRNEAFKQLPRKTRVKSEPFRSQAAYLKHMRDEHNTAPFSCDYPGCNRFGRLGYLRKKDFLKHQQQEHSNQSPFLARKDHLHPTSQAPPQQQHHDHTSPNFPVKEKITPDNLGSVHEFGPDFGNSEHPDQALPNFPPKERITPVNFGSAFGSVEHSLSPECVESQPPWADFGSTPPAESDPSSSSCCFDTPESGIEDFLSITFQECRSSSSQSPTFSAVSHGSNDKSSSNTTPSDSLPSLTNSFTGKVSSKRRRQSIDDEENPNHPNHPRKQKRSEQSGGAKRKAQQGRRLACHFHLLNPKKYCKTTLTGKKYETCSGFGWLDMHHLLQHLADSASSIHKKRRCPRCLNPFTTNTAVVEHQRAHRSGCEQQLVQDSDEISDLTWDEIKSDVSKIGSFKRLPAPLRQTIDLWVQNNLDSYAPNDTLAKRQGELRKWYMTWRILFPSDDIPAHPFYPEDLDISPSNEELLFGFFNGLLESGVDKGEIHAMTDEELLAIQGYLRTALRMAHRARKESDSLGPNQNLPNLTPLLSFSGSASMSNARTGPSQHAQWDMSGAQTHHTPNVGNMLSDYTVDGPDTMMGYNMGGEVFTRNAIIGPSRDAQFHMSGAQAQVRGEASTSNAVIGGNQDAAWQMFEPPAQLPAPNIGNALQTFTANRTATMTGFNVGAETSTSNAFTSATQDAEWDTFGSQTQLPAPNIGNAPQTFTADRTDNMAEFNTGGESLEQMFPGLKFDPAWDKLPAEQYEYEQRVSDE